MQQAILNYNKSENGEEKSIIHNNNENIDKNFLNQK